MEFKKILNYFFFSDCMNFHDVLATLSKTIPLYFWRWVTIRTNKIGQQQLQLYKT